MTLNLLSGISKEYAMTFITPFLIKNPMYCPSVSILVLSFIFLSAANRRDLINLKAVVSCKIKSVFHNTEHDDYLSQSASNSIPCVYQTVLRIKIINSLHKKGDFQINN